ncbi:unnamed protein product [Rotaria sp. Silwood2]|nr:unnamed protein product [Rotaria sp. Silwood2]
MAALLLVITLLMTFVDVTAFNVMGYANVQYTILYYQYRDLSFQSFPFIGYLLQTDWISLPILHSFTNGFFSGIFSNLLEFYATQSIFKMAIDLTLPLASVANITDTHDVGFVIMSSFGHGCHLLKLSEYLQIIITAATSLSCRYSPTVQCTRSWDSKEGFLVIIDNMMNLELLFEASNQTCSTDLVPYWDFDAPHNSTISYQSRDTSAAAIFASDLVELSQYVTARETKDYFLTSAKSIVDPLASPTYLILGNKDYVLRAIIVNGTQGPYSEKPYDIATVLGNYYLTQTVLRLFKL